MKKPWNKKCLEDKKQLLECMRVCSNPFLYYFFIIIICCATDATLNCCLLFFLFNKKNELDQDIFGWKLRKKKEVTKKKMKVREEW